MAKKIRCFEDLELSQQIANFMKYLKNFESRKKKK